MKSTLNINAVDNLKNNKPYDKGSKLNIKSVVSDEISVPTYNNREFKRLGVNFVFRDLANLNQQRDLKYKPCCFNQSVPPISSIWLKSNKPIEQTSQIIPEPVHLIKLDTSTSNITVVLF